MPRNGLRGPNELQAIHGEAERGGEGGDENPILDVDPESPERIAERSPMRASHAVVDRRAYPKIVNAAVGRSIRGHWRLTRHDKDDLAQDAYVEYLRVARRYNPSFGGTLDTYAYARMIGELKDRYRARFHISRNKRTPIPKFFPIESTGEDGLSFLQKLADDRIEPDQESIEAFHRVVGYVEQLAQPDRMVIELYYLADPTLTLDEIAKRIGKSESRVCQIHKRAIARLQTMMGVSHETEA